MHKALATVRGGRVEFDSGVDWPEGTRVEVLPIQNNFGMNESEWPTSPAGIAELLKRMNDREPLEITDAEFAAWEAARESEKERQKEFTRQSWEFIPVRLATEMRNGCCNS